MITDSQAKAVLVTGETADRAGSLTMFTLIDCGSVGRHGFEPVSADGRNDAVILYTSGTTGVPKGTVITRLALSNFGQWNRRMTE